MSDIVSYIDLYTTAQTANKSSFYYFFETLVWLDLVWHNEVIPLSFQTK